MNLQSDGWFREDRLFVIFGTLDALTMLDCIVSELLPVTFDHHESSFSQRTRGSTGNRRFGVHGKPWTPNGPMKLNGKGKKKNPEAMMTFLLTLNLDFSNKVLHFRVSAIILGVCLNYHDEFHVFFFQYLVV